jgi:hypothetical protein
MPMTFLKAKILNSYNQFSLKNKGRILFTFYYFLLGGKYRTIHFCINENSEYCFGIATLTCGTVSPQLAELPCVQNYTLSNVSIYCSIAENTQKCTLVSEVCM